MAGFRSSLAIVACALAFSSSVFAQQILMFGPQQPPARENVDFTKVPGKYIGKLMFPGPSCHGQLRGCKQVAECTATLVGPSYIATAAHCLPSEGYGENGPQSLAAQGAVFLLNYNNNDDTGESTIDAIEQEHVFNNPPSFRGMDWTLARLHEPLGRKFGWIDVSPNHVPAGTVVSSAGYSYDWDGGEYPGIDPNCTVGNIQQTKPTGSPLLRPFPFLYTLSSLWADLTYHPIEATYFTDCEINHGASGGPLVQTVYYPLPNGSVVAHPYLIGINDTINPRALTPESQMSDTSHFFGLLQNLLAKDLRDELVQRLQERPEMRDLVVASDKLYKQMIASQVAAQVSFGGLEQAVQTAASLTAVNQAVVKLTQNRNQFLDFKSAYELGLTFTDQNAPLRVKSVVAGTAAAKAGFKAGDIIEAVDDEEFPTAYELNLGLDVAQGEVTLLVRRGRLRQEVDLEVPSVRE